jgi:hypothetical protein
MFRMAECREYSSKWAINMQNVNHPVVDYRIRGEWSGTDDKVFNVVCRIWISKCSSKGIPIIEHLVKSTVDVIQTIVHVFLGDC